MGNQCLDGNAGKRQMGCLIAIALAIVSSEFFGFFAGKDLSVTVMLYVQGAINANSRKFIESWKSKISNAENPGDPKNIAKPKKPKQTQLRETCDSAAESRPKLDVSARSKLVFQAYKNSLTLV